MQCVEINKNLVGCRVEIELRSQKVEGKVHIVDPSGSRVTIVDGYYLPSKTPTPPMFKVFIKDILKSNF